jgi:hypothetical protein
VARAIRDAEKAASERGASLEVRIGHAITGPEQALPPARAATGWLTTVAGVAPGVGAMATFAIRRRPVPASNRSDD